MRITEHPEGMTVIELKRIVNSWAELDCNMEPTEVWITTGRCLSSPCILAEPLNLRACKKGRKSADILLSPSGDSYAVDAPPFTRHIREWFPVLLGGLIGAFLVGAVIRFQLGQPAVGAVFVLAAVGHLFALLSLRSFTHLDK